MQGKNVADEVLENAYKIMAGIIRDYGEKYLPVFRRLHEERQARKANRELKDIALHVAQDMRQ